MSFSVCGQMVASFGSMMDGEGVDDNVIPGRGSRAK